MEKISFYSQLNGLNVLSDRFDLCHNVPVESTPKNSDAYTIADAKVLFCNYSCNKMDKCYELFGFKIQEPLSQEEFSFIEDFRIGKLDNPLIKGFYTDVICNAQTKPYGKLVDMVIRNYTSYIEVHPVSDVNEVEFLLRSLMYNTTKYNKDKEPIKRIILSFIKSNVELWEKRRLLMDTYNYGFLKADELRKVIYDNNLQCGLSDNYIQNQKFFNMLLNIADKSDNDHVRQIYHSLADNEDEIIKMHPNHIFSANNALAKMEYLNKGGFMEEAKEANKLFLWLKENGQGMETFSQRISIPNWVFQQQVDIIVNSESPIRTIAEDNLLLPSDSCEEIDLFKDLRQLGISMHYTDINGNPHTQEEYDKKTKDNAFNQHYFFTFYVPMLKSLIYLIDNGSFTAEAISTYLTGTWLGKSRVAVNQQLKKTQESWLPLIMPSVRQIVEEIKKEMESNGKYLGNYVCAIDSLTMKIEGCIRDACRRLNIQTVKDNHDEIPLETLLERMQELCNGTDLPIHHKTLRMLYCVLTKRGKNERNNIAHGLTSISDYNIQEAISILHCILKVSTIKIPMQDPPLITT